MSELEWMNTFGDNLACWLDEYKMSQRDLADAAGLSEAAISSYINKRKMPSIKAIINISYALDIDVRDLIDFGDRVV